MHPENPVILPDWLIRLRQATLQSGLEPVRIWPRAARTNAPIRLHICRLTFWALVARSTAGDSLANESPTSRTGTSCHVICRQRRTQLVAPKWKQNIEEEKVGRHVSAAYQYLPRHEGDFHTIWPLEDFLLPLTVSRWQCFYDSEE